MKTETKWSSNGSYLAEKKINWVDVWVVGIVVVGELAALIWAWTH